MTMQRRHFELIAEVVASRKARGSMPNPNGLNTMQHSALAECFAHTLAATNPNFNRDKFLRACGVEVQS